MSTKIHTGFLFRLTGTQPGDGFRQVCRLVQHLRHDLRPYAERQLAIWLIRRAIEFYDQRTYLPETVAGDRATAPLALAYDELHRQQREAAQLQHRHPAVDMSFSLTFFPGSARRLYGIAFTEQPEFFRRWMALPGVSEYRYWNHTDPPTSISSRAWKARGRRWHQLLGTSGVPSHSSFSITVLEERLIPTHPTLQRVYRHAIPSIDARVNRLALDLTLATIRPSSISEAHQLLTELQEGCSVHQSQFHHHQAILLRRLSQPPTLAQLQQGHDGP